MISLVTNVDSLEAQQNLNIDNQFQSKTIQQLTSGYRINSSGDDAAGLAIANGYRSSVTELSQGVMNANDGISQLQIVDGGLSNISTILDRLKTLATESASTTFTGSRATLNQEYSQLLTEVTRQASNINLNAGGTFNSLLSVYIGGATQQSNASVSVDLSGANSAVDATSLGLATTNVLDGGVGIGGNTQRVDAPGGSFVVGTAGTDDQSFTFNVYSGGSAQTVTATVPASANGSSLASVLSVLNGQLNQYGITAGTDSNGALQFSGSNAFTVKDNGGTGTSLLTNDGVISGAAAYTAEAQVLTLTNASGTSATVSLAATDSLGAAITKINAQTATTGIKAVLNAAGTGINLQGGGAFTASTSAAAGVFTATGAQAAPTPFGGQSENTSNYTVDGQANYAGAAQTLNFQTSAGSTSVALLAGDSLSGALAKINAQTASLGVYAVANAAGTGISFQGANSFSVASSAAGVFSAAANNTSTAPTAGNTNNATSAITAIDAAIQSLGLVQGRVGAGENLLQYSVNLAQSQISSFSAAESQIRDADVAAQAANLTKAQVLTQTSVAALAQANSEPQAILKLLQG